VILSTGFAVMFLTGGSRFSFGLVLVPMTQDLGWSRSTLSLALTVFMVAGAIGLPVAGWLVDRYSLKWTMAGGAVIASLGIGLMTLVQSPWQVFIVYGLIYGLGNAGIANPTVGVMISRWFERGRGMAVSAANSGSSAGSLVIIVLFAAAISSAGWRTAYLWLGLANLIILFPLVLFAVRSRPNNAESNMEAGDRADSRADSSEAQESSGISTESTTAIVRSRPFVLLAALYIICGFQDFLVATHLVAFARDQGTGPVLAGNMLALMGAMGFLGVLAAGWMADAVGPGKPTLVCFIMRIGIFALISVYQSTEGIIIFSALYGFTFYITAPLTVIFGGKIFGPARLGTVAGLISSFHMIAGGLGALAGAVIFDQWGSYNGAFVLMLAMSAVAAAVTMMIKEQRVVFAPRPA
jgi:MFS family permease